MNSSRRFGALEIFFGLLALAYLGYAVFTREVETPPAEAVSSEAAIATAVTEATQPPTPLPTTFSPEDRLAEMEENPPALPSGWAERAGLYLEEGDIGAALADADRALRTASAPSTEALAYAQRGDVYSAMGLHEEALRDYTEATILAPENTAYRLKLGDGHRALDQLEKARAAYEVVVESGSQAADADRAAAHYGLGQLLEIEGNLAQNVIISQYRLAAELAPDNADYHHALGQAHEQAGDLSDALEAYTAAIEADPTRADIFLDRAGVFSDRGNYSDATRDLTAAIRLTPDSDVAYNNRGFAYSNMELYEQAIADYTAAISLDPQDAITWANRGSVYNKQEEWELAIEDFTRAIELDPDYGVAYNNRGVAYEGLDEVEAALADYTRAIERQPRGETGIELYNRGVLYYDLGELGLAVADLEAAGEIIPDDSDVWVYLGDVYDAQGRTADAVAAYRTHITTASGAPANRALRYVDMHAAPTPTSDSTG